MLCERCQKEEATTHIKENINGDSKELHLCDECAKQLGYEKMFAEFNPFEDMAVNLQGFLGSLFSQGMPGRTIEDKRCSFCGTTFEELASNAKAGCANCYKEFYNELLPSLARIHGKTSHVGKIPGTAGREIKLKREVESKRKQLQEAVIAQEYETAAKLRDEIKELEKRVTE